MPVFYLGRFWHCFSNVKTYYLCRSWKAFFCTLSKSKPIIRTNDKLMNFIIREVAHNIREKYIKSLKVWFSVKKNWRLSSFYPIRCKIFTTIVVRCSWPRLVFSTPRMTHCHVYRIAWCLLFVHQCTRELMVWSASMLQPLWMDLQNISFFWYISDDLQYFWSTLSCLFLIVFLFRFYFII